MKKLLLLSLIFLASCSLDKVVQHHGVHNLEIKQAKLKINYTNKNDIIKLIGPPSTKSSFDNDLDSQLSLEAKLQNHCGNTRDFQEGVLAFLQKREAKFEGR